MLLQALLEFHLFAPQLPPGGVPALLRLFAAYWSAGVPRIGESGARGWAYWCCWHAMGLEQPAPAPAEDHAEDVQQQQQQVGYMQCCVVRASGIKGLVEHVAVFDKCT